MVEKRGRLTQDPKLSSNRFINNRVWQALQKHDEEGWFAKQERIYLGVETNLSAIWSQFANICVSQDASNRLYVRKSCQDEESRKWHVISLYLRQKYNDGSVDKMYQATWTAPIRKRLPDVKREIELGFDRNLGNRFTFSPNSPLFTEGF